MDIYTTILRHFLFAFPPETAHHLTLLLLKWFAPLLSLTKKQDIAHSFSLWGISFPNRLGLAAGLDKDGIALKSWYHLGFGFVEIGTITPRPQPGNPKPRLFRLPRDQALINRMGFNNKGVNALCRQLEKHLPLPGPLGINMGKNFDTPLANAHQDYLFVFEKVYPFGDYFVVNVSSPNTPGLRQLQNIQFLYRLFSELQSRNLNNKPLLVKLDPELDEPTLETFSPLFKKHLVQGVILTNTTTLRPSLRTSPQIVNQIGRGGLSGLPLAPLSKNALITFKKLYPNVPVINVGGICSPQEAIERINLGASLIQIYTGLVYQGPSLIRNILAHLN